MKVIRDEILTKLERVLELTNKYASEKPYLREVKEMLGLRYEEIKKIGEVKTISKKYVESLLELYSKVTEFENLVLLYVEGKSVYDEVYVSLLELNSSVTKLIETAKSSSFRERILNLLPVATALTYYVFDTAYSLIVTEFKLPIFSITIHLATIVLAIISATIIYSKQVVSYALLLVSGLIGFVNKTRTSIMLSQPLGLDAVIYTSIIFMGVIYLNTARLTASKEYKDKIENTIKNIMSLINRSREQTNAKPDEDAALWNRAIELFKKTHGEKGEDLLKFKVEAMVMNGLNRSDTLKKIIDIYERILNKH